MQEVALKPKRGSFKKAFALLLAFCMCLTLVQTVPVAAADATVASVSLDKATLTMKVGDTQKLTATVDGTPGDTEKPGDTENPGGTENPGDTTDKEPGDDTTGKEPGDDTTGKAPSEEDGGSKAAVLTGISVTWKSDKEAVATVATDGTVKAIAAGTAVITASAGGKEAKCTVTVTADSTPAPVEAATVTLSKKSLTVVKGKTAELKATVGPEGAPQDVKWESSDKKVATVDANGKVKGVKGGTATITVTTANGKAKAACKVTVAEVKLNAAKMAVQKGKSTTALKVESCTPAKDTIKSVKSSKASVATVKQSKGKITVTGKNNGKATITVTMKSGATAACQVTVQKGAVKTKKLTMSTSKAVLAPKKTLKLEVTRDPISATDKITWKSSNTKVATVDKNGKVKAVKAGTAKITATANGKTATCTVTVGTVKLKKASGTVKVKKTVQIQLSSTVKGDKITACKSSDTKIAKVSKTGKVTGVKKGKATITVTTKSGATLTYKVTVK